jgi:PAS domain S-box-containing protein
MTNDLPHNGGQTILYVTTTTEQRERFSLEIQRETEFEVVTIKTVNDALEVLHSRDDIACIVSDYDLPDIDGLAFLQSVRVQFSDLPFILFTCEGNEAVASKAISARVTDYLIKEQFQDQWAELATLIQESITYHQSQRSLATPEVRGKVILEASPEPITILQDERFRYANTNALSLFEVETIEDLAEKGVEDFVAPDSRTDVISSIQALQAEDTLVDRLDTTLVGQRGTETPVELTAVRIEWQESPAILLILRNISKRSEREAELRRFKQAAEAAGHAVYITDKDGTIEYVNPAFESITGYSSDEAIGKNPRILNSGEMSEEYFAELWDTVLAGDVWEEEVINERKDGELYHAHQTIAPITNSEGFVQAFVAIQADITEQKRLEEELGETKERYESLFNSIRDAILVADTDRKIINCNLAFTDLFGYELAEIEGKHTKYVYVSEEEYQEMGEAIEGHFDDPSFTYTVSYEKKTGQTFSGETAVSNLRDADGEVIGFIGVIRDVSERKERIRQIQKVDRILRHNFRNNMNVIEGTAQHIQKTTDGAIESQAAKIIESAEKLRGIVEKEREVTKFLDESTSVTNLNIGNQTETIVSDIRNEYPDAKIELEIQGDTTGLAVSEISLAIEELIENAVIHAETDRPTIRVEMERAQDVIKLSVTDENPVIPDMERAVLLEEAEIDPLYHGSRMGLWLVNLIVSHSDGILEFRENEPRGNVVTIRLPAE